MKFPVAFFFILLCAFGSLAQAATYTVARGDTLSDIAQMVFGPPVYSKQGSLTALMRLNPQVKNFRALRPGDSIEIGNHTVAKSSPAPSPLVAASPVPSTRTISSSPQVSTPTTIASEEEPSSRISLSAGIEYLRINATDRSTGAVAAILSNSSPMAKLEWELRWTKKWATKVYLEAEQDNFQDFESSSQSIVNTSFRRYAFGAGASYSWSPGRTTGVSLGGGSYDFARGLSQSAITLDRVSELSLSVIHEEELLRLKTASLGAEVAAFLLGSGSGPGYSTSLGAGGQVGIYMRHEFGLNQLRADLFYRQSSQNSDIAKQTEKNLGLTVGYSRSLE